MTGLLFLIFTTSLLTGFTGALMPGPLLTVTVSESAQRGFRAGPMLVLGHGIAELLLIVTLWLGLSRLLEFGQIKGAIALVGGLVLVWMGLRIVRSVLRGEVSLTLARDGDSRPGRRHVVTGAIVSASNPYWIIWWATGGAALMSWSLSAGALGLVAFYLGHILSDLGWYSAIAASVVVGGRLFSNTAYRTILAVCALFLVGLGLYFASSGVGFIAT